MARMEPKRELKPASRDVPTFVAVIFAIVGVMCAAFSFPYFLNGRGYTAAKLLGFSLYCFGACFDPVNCLWNVVPWNFGQLVKSPRKSGFFFLFWGIGSVLIIIGWLGDGYFDEPPKTQLVPKVN